MCRARRRAWCFVLVRTLAVTLLVLGLIAVPARAATVSTTPTVASFTAAPGEVNRVTASVAGTSFTPGHAAAPYDVIIRDDGAPLSAGPGCTALDAHAARCDFVASVSIDSGDGDDSVSVAAIVTAISTGAGADRVVTPDGLASTVDAGEGDDIVSGGGTLGGGAGNDTLSGGSILDGGPGDDVLSSDWATFHGGDGDDRITGGGTLSGGPGRDTLTAGPGYDGLYGGPGEDVLSGGAGTDRLDGDAQLDLSPPETAPPSVDRLDGGPDVDTVAYAARAQSVTVDLAARTSGSTGEQDILTSIENALGGPGPDRLLGDGGPNVLDGSDGKDVLEGRGGTDDLTGGYDRAADRLAGGPGDDDVHGSFNDTLTCGPGIDRVPRHRNTTTVDIACERLAMAGGRWRATVRLSRSAVRAPVRCDSRCSGALEVRLRGATIGRARLVRRRSGALMVRLTRHGATVELRARFFDVLDSVRLRL